MSPNKPDQSSVYMSPVSPVLGAGVTVSLTLYRLSVFLFLKQVWVLREFQTEVHDPYPTNKQRTD